MNAAPTHAKEQYIYYQAYHLVLRRDRSLKYFSLGSAGNEPLQ